MVDVWLPYGKTEVCARIPTRNYLGTITPKEKPGVGNPRAEIARALKEPVGTTSLSDTINPGDRVAIVVDDGPSGGEMASTVVDCTGDSIRILRHGPIAMEDLLEGESL
jgi:tRNA A37 threonylcarbamoyladenosine synthetase subunit TsaC/SUA5/YrdC